MHMTSITPTRARRSIQHPGYYLIRHRRRIARRHEQAMRRLRRYRHTFRRNWIIETLPLGGLGA